MSVRTRFAPSPTGFLHIGGARTALFNCLFARRHGGQYLLRIEDTDRARSTQQAVDQILESLAWLGLSPDEPPVFQSAREARHAEVAHALLAMGRAYLAFETPEELAALRERAMAEGRPPRYDGAWRDRDPAEAPAGRRPAIRLKAPREGETVVRDLVQGEVRVANAELDDMIILRSDGTPTYLHAVVVDDHDMAITHVIRGDDHLTNTFRQAQIYDAMGWPRPRFAHIPLIHGADGAKLSKRHGAVSVLDFREQGYLPEAVCNYLLRLGWGHGDEEVISRARAEAVFDLDGVGRAASRMDYAKLTHLNGVWLRQAEDERLSHAVLERLARRGALFGTLGAERVRILMPDLKERARTLEDLAGAAVFAAQEGPPALDAKAAAALTPEAKARLADLAQFLSDAPWERADLEAWLRDYADVKGVRLGTVAQPLRAALTGSLQSPPIDAVLFALGRTEAMDRIRALGQPGGRNGVAVLGRIPFEVTAEALPGEPEDTQARYIEVAAEGLLAAGIYLPNGNSGGEDGFAYKLRWLDRLAARMRAALDAFQPLVVLGDYNVCPTEADLAPGALPPTDALVRPESRARFRALLHLGMTDALRALHPGDAPYTYWDYGPAFEVNRGLRIDHILLTPELAERLAACGVDTDARAEEQPSDHAPVWCDLAPLPPDAIR